MQLIDNQAANLAISVLQTWHMKILITGATGFLGCELGKVLCHSGHQIVALTRSKKPIPNLLPYPAEIFSWDYHAESFPAQALTGIEAVINLAGESVADKRWSQIQKKELFDSRIQTTKKLMNAFKQNAPHYPKIWINASAIGFYGHRPQEVLTEKSTRGELFFADLTSEWEAELLQNSFDDMRKVIIRIGIVLGKSGGALQKMLPLFRMGLAGKLGSGQQMMSWIHIDDLVKMFLFALENPGVHGVLNGTAPNPVSNLEFTKTLASILKRPAVLAAPTLALKIALGEMADMLLADQNVVPEAAMKLGFRFQYSQLAEAIQNILGTPR